jgi:hypothetical protein
MLARCRDLGGGIRPRLPFSAWGTRGSIEARRASCVYRQRSFPRRAISSSTPRTLTSASYESSARRRFDSIRDLRTDRRVPPNSGLKQTRISLALDPRSLALVR